MSRERSKQRSMGDLMAVTSRMTGMSESNNTSSQVPRRLSLSGNGVFQPRSYEVEF